MKFLEQSFIYMLSVAAFPLQQQTSVAVTQTKWPWNVTLSGSLVESLLTPVLEWKPWWRPQALSGAVPGACREANPQPLCRQCFPFPSEQEWSVLTDLEKVSLAACTLESPGKSFKVTSVGPHPDQLKQNLWGWAQASTCFKSSQVIAKCSQVRALPLEAYLPKSGLVSGPFF